MLKKSPPSWLKKHKAFGLLTLITALIAVTGATEPFDLIMKAVGSRMFPVSPSGHIEVVGIDSQAIRGQATGKWTPENSAELTVRLIEAGAEKVFFASEIDGSERELQTFARVAGRYPGKVYTSERIEVQNGQTLIRTAPVSILKVAPAVSTTYMVEFWGGARNGSYRLEDGAFSLPSLAAVASGKQARKGDYPIDYRIQASEIPYMSAAAAAGLQKGSLAGKSVIVGPNTDPTQKRNIVGQRPVPTVFLNALDAETLIRGNPISIGWWPGWLFALGCAMACLTKKSTRFGLSILGAASAGLIASYYLLEASQIYLSAAPGLLTLMGAAVIVTWRRFGAEERKGGTVHPFSGLQTVNTLRYDETLDKRQVICARVRRYADVVTAMPAGNESEFVNKIIDRLKLGTLGADLIHGDEGNFFFLTPLHSHDELLDQFSALSVIFRSPITVGKSNYDVDVSFGIDREFHQPVYHRTLTALAAAYESEQAGIRWKLHDPSNPDEKAWSVSMLGELETAMKSGAMWVAYQPKLDLNTGLMSGAEALVRWTHPIRGPISPAHFVDMAEKHGRIDSLTSYVLHEALKTTRSILADFPDFVMSVNISPALLRSGMIIETVRQALKAYDVPAEALMLEVTETYSLDSGDAPAEVMEGLRALGVKLSIDDYGTGMCTLEYLQRIPAVELKIDRRFVANVTQNARDKAVLASTISLAHALGMKAVAEGIEDQSTLSLVKSLGADIAQGYHIERPVEARILLGRLATNAENMASAVSLL